MFSLSANVQVTQYNILSLIIRIEYKCAGDYGNIVLFCF